MPKINVVVPVYNGEEGLGRLCDTLVAQSYDDFRVMIIDNASEDRTGEIARNYATRDSRFIYFRNHKNMGFTFSYTRGFYASLDCEYMAYISSGDYLAPDYFKECVAALEADSRTVLAYSYFQFADHDGQPVGPPQGDNFEMAGQGPQERYLTIISRLGLCTAFYGLIRMSAYADLHTFFRVPSAAMDNMMLAGLAFKGDFAEIKQPLLFRKNDLDRDANYISRQNRLHQMSKSVYWYMDSLFYLHIAAHLGLIQTFYDYKHGLKPMGDLYIKTLEVLTGRYKVQLEADAEMFAAAVMAGRLFTSMDNSFNASIPGLEERTLGDYPILDAHTLSELSALLEKHYWLNVRLKPKNICLARALLYLWQGRKEEALGALNQELINNPTSRPAYELKFKLQKSIASTSNFEELNP